MQKSLAVAAALGVIALFFGQDLFPAFAGTPKSEGDKSPSSLISLPSKFNFPKLGIATDPVTQAAWGIFEQYRTYAKESNLEGVISLSHQVSDTCANPETREECDTLMQSVYLFTEDWQQNEFKEVAYDDKQIILSTGYTEVNDDGTSVEAVILFTRATDGTPKMLGINFCGGSAETEEKCVDTDPTTRDENNNGWWDDVEAKFYR